MSDIEDARYEDLGRGKSRSSKAAREVQRYESQNLVRREQNLFEEQSRAVDPRPQGFLEHLSPARALERASRNTQKLTQVARDRADFVRAHTDLIDATVVNRSAAEIARAKVERLLKAEEAMGEQIEQEARLTRLQAEREELRLRQESQTMKDEERRRRDLQDQLRENDQLDAQIAREEKLYQLEQLRQARAQLSSPETPPAPAASAPGRAVGLTPELENLVQGARAIEDIRRYCDAKRAFLKQEHGLGVTSPEQYEDALDLIERQEARAIAAYEARVEQGG